MAASCPTCKAENPEAAKFCNQCGARLDAAAPGRETRNYTPKHLADKIFKTRAAMEGERKRVTVLFCDIKGSTRLAQEAGAEQWHVILDRFFSILSAAVHRYEGTVNQYTGDGVMALFGAPIAHEDHASRASFAALEMQREVRRFADELRLQKNLNLSMRVGLNTGEVIVGKIGDDLRMDYTAQGPTVNLAARMEHICEPGRIYITRNTAKLVEGYFRLRDLGRMNVAGLDEPVEVYELEGEGALKTRLDRSLARGASLFVGHERELSLLTQVLERVRNGEGQVAAVVGNAGIGKSRLCHEFTRACEDSGIAVHRATGVPYASALPMYPVQALAKSRLGLPERASHADIRKFVAGTFLLHDPNNAAILPVVFDFLGAAAGSEGAQITPDQAAAAREKMLSLLAEFLPCAEEPQILLVEDLHFLDTASEEFLAKLCCYIKKSKTLLLLNYRPDYVSEWLIPHLDEQIAVSALTPEHLENLACDWLGPHPSLKGIATRIRERASGNPFFVEEAVLALEEAGFITGERGAYELTKPIVQWPVPDTVHALLAARMDRLEEGHKNLLQTASVIGQEFSAGWLSRLAEDQEVDEGLAVLEDAGFVHQKRGGNDVEYAFCHPLMQEVAYGAQLESRRAQAHARIAQALERAHPLTGTPTQSWLQIAHHWQRAGEWARAGAWNLAAAKWGVGRDVHISLEQFRAAIANLDRAPDSPEVIKQRIGARAGIIRMGQFSPIPLEEMERSFKEARQMAENARDPLSLAELMISYSNEQLHRGEAEAAVRTVQQAVASALAVGAGDLVPRFRLAILLTHNSAGHPREGVELINSASGTGWLEEPISADNFMSRGFYGFMLCWLGRLPEAESHMLPAVEFSERDGRAASWMYANLVDHAWFTGRDGLMMQHARRAVEAAEAFGSPFFSTVSARAMSRALCMTGQHAKAVELLEPLRAHAAPGGLAHQFEANFLATLSDAYLGAGRIADAVKAASESVASAQRSDSRLWEIVAWLAYLNLPQDGPWAARTAEGLARCEELIASSGTDGLKPWLLMARANVAKNEVERRRHQQAAMAEFERQGAAEHARRLRQKLDKAA